MPRVQDYGGPQARVEPAQTRGPSAVPSAETLGAGLGSQLQQAGQDISQIAQSAELQKNREAAALAERERVRAGQIAIQSAEVQSGRIASDLERGEKGFRRVRGPDALKAIDSARETFDKESNRIELTLGTPEAREEFRLIRARQAAQMESSANAYWAEESERFDVETTQAALELTSDEAVRRAALGDFKGVEAVWNATLDRVEQFSDRMYDSPEQRRLRIAQAGSSLHTKVVKGLLAAGQDVAAKDYFEKSKPLMMSANITELEPHVTASSIEGDAMRAADDIWSKLGPKNDADPVNIDQMATAARELYADDPKRARSAVANLRERTEEFRSGAKDRLDTAEASVWQSVLNGAKRAELFTNPQFIGLSGDRQTVIANAVEDRLYTIEQRAQSAKEFLDDQAWEEESRRYTREGVARTRRNEAEQRQEKAAYAAYEEILSDPEAFSKMTPQAILTQLPKLGKTLTNDLLTKQRAFEQAQKPASVTLEADLFNELAEGAGLQPFRVTKTEGQKSALGALRKFTMDRIDEAQRAKGNTLLNRDEKQAIMEKALIEVIPANKPCFGFNTDPVRAFELTIDKIPAADRTGIENYFRSLGLPFTPQDVVDQYIETKGANAASPRP